MHIYFCSPPPRKKKQYFLTHIKNLQSQVTYFINNESSSLSLIFPHLMPTGCILCSNCHSRYKVAFVQFFECVVAHLDQDCRKAGQSSCFHSSTFDSLGHLPELNAVSIAATSWNQTTLQFFNPKNNLGQYINNFEPVVQQLI